MKFIKEFFAEIVIGLTVAILAIAIAFFISGCVAHAAITAPESAKPGELVRVTSDVEADWIVQPDEYSANVYVDSNKKTLVLSSSTPGKVYIFAATNGEDNSPKAFCWTLTITPDAPDNPTPSPTPTPVPDKYPSNVIKAINSIATDTVDKEKATFISVLKSTIGFINDGSIKTIAGARETIRRNWTLQTATVNTNATEDWQAVMELVFSSLSDDIQAAKSQLETLLKAMEGTK